MSDSGVQRDRDTEREHGGGAAADDDVPADPREPTIAADRSRDTALLITTRHDWALMPAPADWKDRMEKTGRVIVT